MGDYSAVTTTWALDTTNTAAGVWEPRASLLEARGDAHAVAVGGQEAAYIIGGFTHLDGWCNALASVERYDFNTDTWTRADSLVYERGDKAVAVIRERYVLAMGGEANTDCDLDPSQRTAPTTEVEVLDTKQGEDAEWVEEIADIPDDHFRFPAVAIGDTIYTFGGQAYYQADCECFPTRDTIFTYTVVEPRSLGTAAIAGIAGGAVVVLAVVLIAANAGNKKEEVVAEQEMQTAGAMN